MGGRAIMTSATNKLKVDRSYRIEEAATASYESETGQLSADQTAKHKQVIDNFNENSERKRGAIGGLQELVFDDKEGFPKWSKTVADAPHFVDFVISTPMAGIWRLCKDTEQATYLRNYYESTWAPRVSSEYQRYADWVDDLAVVMGNRPDVSPPDGYTRIPQDLNESVGGKYIYLCKHKAQYGSRTGSANRVCINDITVVYGEGAKPPAGYTMLPHDLNSGAGGWYVYLCFRKVPFRDDEAIKDVTVIGSRDKNVAPPYNYHKVDLNLSAGAAPGIFSGHTLLEPVVYTFICTSINR